MHTPPSSAALPSSSRLLVGRRPPLPLLRRSSSLRSRRSVTSTGSSSSATVATTASGSKKVSFHRDVRVKRIPSYLGERGRVGVSFRRRHKPVPQPDPSAGLVRRLDPPHSRQALAKEARKVLREADRVTCTTLPLPKQGGKAAVPLLLLNRRKSRRAQPPPRLLITPPSPPTASPTPAVVTFSSEEGGGASTTDYSSLERPTRERRKKKALSPIIEAATPVIAPNAADYFNARIGKDPVSDGALRNGRDESSLESLKEDYREEEEEDDVEEEEEEDEEGGVGGMMKVHSSQMPAERPPLTRGTVTGLAQQLSITRRPIGPPPVVGRNYVSSSDVYGSEDHIVNHNNNRPFSYTDPSAVQAALAKSGAQSKNGVDADGGLDSRIPRGKEVIYAQVVVSGREGGGAGGEGGGPASRTGGGGVKRTVHTSVLNHQRGEKVPVLEAESSNRYVRSKGGKRLGSEGEEEEEEEEDFEEKTTKTVGEEEEEDEGIAGDMMRIGGGGAGGVTTSTSYYNHRRTTSSRTADGSKVVDYIDGDYRSRPPGPSVQNQQKGGRVSDPRRIEHYKRYDEDDEDDLDRNYRRGSLDYGLNKTENFTGKGGGLGGYNRKDLFDSGIENDSGVGGSGRRRPKTGGKVVVGEGVTAKIVMNGGPNLRSNLIGGSCNNISRVTITNDNSLASPANTPKDRYFYYGASPEDTSTLTDKRRGSAGGASNKSSNAPASSMASARLVRAADKRRDADLPTSSVLIRHWAPSSDDKHDGQEQQLVVEESVVQQENYFHRRRRRRRTKDEEEEEEELEEGTGPLLEGDDGGHWRRNRGLKEKGRGRLEDLEEEEQRVNGKGGSHSDEEYDDRNNNTSVTGSNRRYQKKGEAALKKKVAAAALVEEEEHHAADKKVKDKKKGGKDGDGDEGVKAQKKRGFRHLFSRGKSSGVKESEEKAETQRTEFDSRRGDRNDGYASAEDRRSHGHSTNHDPAGRQKDRWFSEDEIDRRGDRTPPSRRRYPDGQNSSATLSRLVANNNRKNKASASSGTTNDSGGRWFKSLDRLTRRKKKEEEEEEEVQENEVPLKESPPPRESTANSGNKKNLRFFGDTDQESVASANHSRRNGRRAVGIIASGRRSGASEEEESGTTTESSAPSQRSVYLHAATVGDIPGPAKTSTPAPPPTSAALNKAARRKAGSREELSQRRPMVTSKTTLSRSVSVLAPWRPRYRPGSNVDVHYDNNGAYTAAPHGMVTGRPPKAPRTANGNGVKSSRGMSASVESLQRGGTKKASPPRQIGSSNQRSGGRDSGSGSVERRGERRTGTSRRDAYKGGMERVPPHESSRTTSGTSVTRSASMPKDSRLAGWWFRRKKVGQAPGKENYGGSANRG